MKAFLRKNKIAIAITAATTLVGVIAVVAGAPVFGTFVLLGAVGGISYLGFKYIDNKSPKY